MNLARARRAITLGQYVYPASCLAIAAMAWERDRTGGAATIAAALGLAGIMWWVLRLAARWLGAASAEREDIGNQLIQSQKTLALGEISTGIAHEINNPLNIIVQEAELIRVNLNSDPSPEALREIRDSLDVIDSQVSRCSDITHKLLDFARSRKTVSQFADINRLLEDMLALVERETGPKNIRIVRLFDDDMPLIKTDPPLLRQVFLNILINAVQAVEKDGGIFVTTYCTNDRACAEIRDTGPGIPAQDWSRVFNPFFTTKPPGEGTGLGLSVSLRIINELGGNITVDSPPDKRGARFTVCIPRQPGR
ncbi:MAG: two-component sensor histidine kinase [Desulfovibrionaceae bacterium]|nr:two-component sensor histidine kinase [Desulfovibrionaceae bacterium]